MKFPKEKVLINNRIKESLKQNNYFEVLKMKDEILKEEYILDDYAYESLIMSAFLLGDFDNVVMIFSEITKRKRESLKLIYYGLLGLLANTDIYQAISYIKKSEILNQNDVKEYYSKDGANYSNILYLNKTDEYKPLVLVLVNFIEGIAKEVVGNIDLDNDYILFRFFDLINMLYEIGYSEDVIEKLTLALKIIFNLNV